jgi:hypothetical protein
MMTGTRKPKNDEEALVMALLLAIVAEGESQEALIPELMQHAQDLSAGMTEKQIERCKTRAELRARKWK